jgi:hypothetical protein
VVKFFYLSGMVPITEAENPGVWRSFHSNKVELRVLKKHKKEQERPFDKNPDVKPGLRANRVFSLEICVVLIREKVRMHFFS